MARPLRRDAAENQQRLLAAAVSAMVREGRHVPLSVIAAEAGVGIGTLYRKYANREDLLDALTVRSMALLADIAEGVCARGGTGLEQLDHWWDDCIADYDQLVLPMGGGPALTAAARVEQKRLHAAMRRILSAGHEDGTVRADVTLLDIIHFGAMLVAPVHGQREWRAIATRQKQIHLDGLGAPTTSSPHDRGSKT